jgi:hypothetical protein
MRVVLDRQHEALPFVYVERAVSVYGELRHEPIVRQGEMAIGRLVIGRVLGEPGIRD